MKHLRPAIVAFAARYYYRPVAAVVSGRGRPLCFVTCRHSFARVEPLRIRPCYCQLHNDDDRGLRRLPRRFVSPIPTPAAAEMNGARSIRRMTTTDDNDDTESGENDDPQGVTSARRSVSGIVYGAGADEDNEVSAAAGSSAVVPRVQLYTKEGCTLCDNVETVLRSIRGTHPHVLEAVDITDEDNVAAGWYSKYKWDIPVLHLDGKYWTKHRLTTKDAVSGLSAAAGGAFQSQPGEPDAGEMERKMAERREKEGLG